MANLPDLVTMLKLDPTLSEPTFGANVRTIIIGKHLTNCGDFAFSSLLNYFARKGASLDTQSLLICLHHTSQHYTACAAKSGVNLSTSSNKNLKPFSLLYDCLDQPMLPLDGQALQSYILSQVTQFIDERGFYEPGIPDKKHTDDVNTHASTPRRPKPVNILVDDLSHLESLGMSPKQVFILFHQIHKLLDAHNTNANYLVVQTLYLASDPNSFVLTLAHAADIFITLQPLKSGFSKLVDGNVAIVDNRSSIKSKTTTAEKPSSDCFDDSSTATVDKSPSTRKPLDLLSQRLTCDRNTEIGDNKSFFFKLSDRRVKLMAAAMLKL